MGLVRAVIPDGGAEPGSLAGWGGKGTIVV